VDIIIIVLEFLSLTQIVAINRRIPDALVTLTRNCRKAGVFRARHQVVLGFTLTIIVGTIVMEVKVEEDRVGPVEVQVQTRAGPVEVQARAGPVKVQIQMVQVQTQMVQAQMVQAAVQTQMVPVVEEAEAEAVVMVVTKKMVTVVVEVDTEMTTETMFTMEMMIPTTKEDKAMVMMIMMVGLLKTKPMTTKLSLLTKTCTMAIRNMIQSMTLILKRATHMIICGFGICPSPVI